MRLALLLLTLFLSTHTLLFAQEPDSTKPKSIVAFQTDSVTGNTTPVLYGEADDFPLVWVIMIFYPVAATIVVALALVCMLTGFFILLGLITAGVVSASVITGLYKKSFAKGFKVFLVLSCALGGAFTFAALFGLTNLVLHWYDTLTSVLAGAGFGLISGMLFGFLAFYVLQRIVIYFKARLNL